MQTRKFLVLLGDYSPQTSAAGHYVLALAMKHSLERFVVCREWAVAGANFDDLSPSVSSSAHARTGRGCEGLCPLRSTIEVGGLPGLGPDGKSGPTWVAAAATPHGGNTPHNAAQHARASRDTRRNLPAHEST